MAEILAVVGVVASILQIIDIGQKLVHRMRDFQSEQSSKISQPIETELRTLLPLLEKTKVAVQDGNITAEGRHALLPILDDCERQIKLLNEIENRLPQPGDAWSSKASKAILNLRKDAKVAKIKAILHGHAQTLQLYHILASSTRQEAKDPQFTHPAFFFTVPFQRDPDFVDREILSEIQRIFSRPASHVALVGLGGVGKSQLAIEYSYQVLQNSPNVSVFWVHASSVARFEESYRNIAECIKIAGRDDPGADILQLVKDWLSDEANGRWLMIVDSADDADIFSHTDVESKVGDSSNIATLAGTLSGPLFLADESKVNNSGKTAILAGSLLEFLPQTQNGSILVTSRSQDVALRIIGDTRNVIMIDSMNEGFGMDLLRTKLQRNFNEDDAKKLLHTLDYFPLAITQAAAFINRSPDMTLSKYVQAFQKGDSDMASVLNRLIPDEKASNSVIKTVEISFESICKERPSASQLLSLMCLFNPDGIPKLLLDYQESDKTESDFEDDINTLYSYALIRTNSALPEFQMHRVIRAAIQEWLELRGELEKWKEKFILIMDEKFPVGKYENWKTCQKLFPHVKEALKYQPVNQDYLKRWASILFKAGWYACENGNYHIAEEMNRRALNVYEKALGSEHPLTLSSRASLALTYTNQGRWEEAEELDVQVMEMRKRVLSAEHPDTLASMGNVASTYRNQGRWDEAEGLEVQVVEIRKRELGPEHPDTLTSLANLASTYRNQGRWKEAEELELQVVETFKRALGMEHPSTLTSMANLASTYRNQGRWEEAEQLSRQVMKAFNTILGAEHPSTLASMNNLVSIYNDQGRWKEAKELGMQVMETRKRVLGAEHPFTLISMNNLASTYRNQGRWLEAEELVVHVIDMRKRVLGEEHPDTLTSMANLASTYSNLGRWEEAEKLELQVTETRKKVLGIEHPDTLTSMANLVLTYIQQGRWEEAEKLGALVVKMKKRVLGAEHPHTLASINNLASTLWSQGRWEEAEDLEVQVTEIRKRVLGAEHPETVTSMANLALLYTAQGQWKEAEDLYVQAMEIQKRVLGVENPSTLSSMANLASMYSNQGRWNEAEDLNVQVTDFRKRVLGEEHPHTLESMTNLAKLCASQARWKEAEDLEAQVMEIRKRIFGMEHPLTLASMANLALTYKNQGRLEEAENLELQIMQRKEKVLSVEDSFTRPDLNEKAIQSSQRTSNDDQLSLPELAPSLTSGPTVESEPLALDKIHNKELLMSQDTVSDTGSVASVLPSGVSEEEKRQIIMAFAHAIAEKFRKLKIKFLPSSVTQDRARQVFAFKLRRYAKILIEEMPQTVEFRRTRNAAKVVFWYRGEIVDEFVRITFPAHEQDTERERTVWTNESIQELSERVNAWHIDSASFYENYSAIPDERFPYPADALYYMTTQETDLDAEMHPDMQFEHVDDGKDSEKAQDSEAIHDYLTAHREFDILESEFQKIVKHYYGDTMKLIQISILGVLGASTSRFKAKFRTQWNIRDFIEEQYGFELQDIRHILAITGNCHDAQMTTVGCYFKQTWPGYSNILIDKLQYLILKSNLNELEGKPSQPSENCIEVSVAKDTVSVNAVGSAEFICAIGQQLAWLGSVCRLSRKGLCYCDTLWTYSESGASSGENSFEIEYEVVSFDKDESTLCWHSLVGDFVMATGFPIPRRSYTDRGLQIPMEIMAALGGISVAVDFGSGFYLKGETIAFIPVEKRNNRVQWHLIDRGREPLDYEYLDTHGIKHLPQSTLDGEAINSSTVFLGWTPYVMNFAATDKINYSDIKWSGSCATPEITIAPSGGSITFSKIVGAGLAFQIGRKQTSSSTQTMKDYKDILHDLRGRSVFLYDTATRRSWLIDAERAVLQIILHRSKIRAHDYIDPGIKFKVANHMEAGSAKSAMESNEQVRLRKGWDSAEGKEMDIWFSAIVKEIWEMLKALAFKSQSEYKRCFSLADFNLGSRGFVGFEYMGWVTSSADLEQHPMKVTLDSDCGYWPHLAHDLGAVVLLARDFQEVLSPRDEVSLCPKFRKLPSQKSYLATEVTTIRKFIEQYSVFNSQKRLSATNITWIVSENVFTPCNQQDGEDCSCKRVQELRKTSSKKVNLGELWDGGAIIFGARFANHLMKEGPETGRRQQPPLNGPEAVSSLIAAGTRTVLHALPLGTFQGPA